MVEYLFKTECQNPHSKEIEYMLFQLNDIKNTVALSWYQTGKSFLKTCKYSSTGLGDFTEKLAPSDCRIGNCIKVYSRILKIIQYENQETISFFKSTLSPQLILFHPSQYEKVGMIMSDASFKDCVIENICTLKLTPKESNNLTGSDEFASNSTIAVKLCGNRDILEVSPGIILSEEDCSQYEKIIFSIDRPTTAIFNNCSLCIVRNYAFQKIGDILKELGKTLEISAIRTLCLSEENVEQFFSCYKSVIPNWSTAMTPMYAHSIIAIQVRASNAVAELRKIAGPYKTEIAQAIAPDSLRSKFGKDNNENGIYVTDLESEGVMECEYFFYVLGSKNEISVKSNRQVEKLKL